MILLCVLLLHFSTLLCYAELNHSSCRRATASSLADTGAQVQRLLRDKLERDLGRPIDRGNANGNGKLKSPSGQLKANIVPEGNIVPPQPDQVFTQP